MLISHKCPRANNSVSSLFFLPLIQKVILFVQDILNMNPLSFYLSTCSLFFKSSIENLVSNGCKYQ